MIHGYPDRGSRRHGDSGYQDTRVRKVAVQVTGDPTPFIMCGADRYWVGVRGSVRQFLDTAADGTLDRWLETAARSRRKVGLVTPYCVDQTRFDQVLSEIRSRSGLFDRLQTGDLGIAAQMARIRRVYWCGRVHNVDHALFLRGLGVYGVRALSPVSTGAMDVNHDIDLEMPVFGRIPVAFTPDYEFPGGEPVPIHGCGGSVIVHPGYIETADFLDLSDAMRPFGRDTCGVVESSGLTPDEVAEAVDAIRFGRQVDTERPLFSSEINI